METIVSAFPEEKSLPSGIKSSSIPYIIDTWNDQVFNAIPKSEATENVVREVAKRTTRDSLCKYLKGRITKANVNAWLDSSQTKGLVTDLSGQVERIANNFWNQHFVVESDGIKMRVVDAFLPMVTVSNKTAQFTVTDVQKEILQLIYNDQKRKHEENPTKYKMPLPVTQMNSDFVDMIGLLKMNDAVSSVRNDGVRDEILKRGESAADYVAFKIMHEKAPLNRKVLTNLLEKLGASIETPLPNIEKGEEVYSRDVLCYALQQVVNQLQIGEPLVREKRQRNTSQKKKESNDDDDEVLDDPQDGKVSPPAAARTRQPTTRAAAPPAAAPVVSRRR